MIEEDKQNLQELARNMRHHMTEYEFRLWIRCLKRLPVTIYRQKIIGEYIVDFYCASRKLIIEVDGSHHYEGEQLLKDQERDAYFIKNGYQVMRITNYDVAYHFDRVCAQIEQAIMPQE